MITTQQIRSYKISFVILIALLGLLRWKLVSSENERGPAAEKGKPLQKGELQLQK